MTAPRCDVCGKDGCPYYDDPVTGPMTRHNAGAWNELRERWVRMGVLDQLYDRIRYHYDHACDAECGDMTAANHAVQRYGHVLTIIRALRVEIASGAA